MSLTYSLDALIIDPNPSSRGFLWQATLAEVNFRKVKAYSKLDTALRMLGEGWKYDVILITSAYSKDEVREFVHTAKTTDGGKEAAYVCVLKSAHQTTDNVAFGLIDGTDGFLLEPYSVDSLRQVAAIAARVKREFDRQRKKAAITLILREVMKTLDAYALAQTRRKEVKARKHEFLDEVKALKKLDAEDIELYHEVALELFETAPPRPAISYHGASERVKQRLKEMAATKKDK